MFKASFDFDGTLTKTIVQGYCKELILRDVDVYITTSRFFNRKNQDLYNISDKLNIKRENIIFTNNLDKSEFIDNSFIFHLDGNFSEVNNINNKLGKPVAICLYNFSTDDLKWKTDCEFNFNNYLVT